jgi:hypothetical protein
MKFSELSSSKYLAKTDVPAQGINLTIASFSLVQLDDGKKPAMAFLEANVKPLLLNATNRNRLTDMFGTDDSQQMIGQRVNVYNDPNVEMGGKLVGGLRVRPLKRAEVVDRGELEAAQTALANARLGRIIPVAEPLPMNENDLARALKILEQRAAGIKAPSGSTSAVLMSHNTTKGDDAMKADTIMVLMNGWVLVGLKGDTFLLDARVIRRWGTTKGLGELANGPLQATVLDYLGPVKVEPSNVLFTLPVVWT